MFARPRRSTRSTTRLKQQLFSLTLTVKPEINAGSFASEPRFWQDVEYDMWLEISITNQVLRVSGIHSVLPVFFGAGISPTAAQIHCFTHFPGLRFRSVHNHDGQFRPGGPCSVGSRSRAGGSTGSHDGQRSEEADTGSSRKPDCCTASYVLHLSSFSRFGPSFTLFPG